MAKPESTAGYQVRWMQLAEPIFKDEGLDIRSGAITDMEAHERAITRGFRAYLIECYIDECIEQSGVRFAGMTRLAVLAHLVVDKHGWSFKEAFNTDREVLETILMSDLTHWRLPDLAFRVALGQVNSLARYRDFLLPHCPEELKGQFDGPR